MNTPRLRIPFTLSLGLGLLALVGTLLPLRPADERSSVLAKDVRYVQASGDVFCVTPGGGSYLGCAQAFANVQTAVDAATGGETIKVATGVFTDVHQRDSITQVVYISKTVTVRGGYATTNWSVPYPLTQPTTLNAQGQGRVIYITGDISPTLEGLRFTDGNATGDVGGGVYIITATAALSNNQVLSNTADSGGGLYLNSSAAMLNGNTVASNTANSDGGGLYLNSSAAILTGNTIVSNSAINSNGGGLYLNSSAATLNGNTIGANNGNNNGGGLDLHYSNATLAENTITGNHVVGWGGGLALYFSNPTLDHNVISANIAERQGAGLFLWQSYPTLSENVITNNAVQTAFGYSGGGLEVEYSGGTFIGNIITNNSATYVGGGIALSQSSPTLMGNIIANNTSNYQGGGLAMYNCAPTLINNWITDNWAASLGSGMHLEGASPTLLHNTLTRNTGGDGSGIYVTSIGTFVYSTVVLTDTILVDQTIGVYVTNGNTAKLEATLWGSGSWANDTDWGGAGAIITGAINVRGDPAFVDPNAGDYHIREASAAKDSGVNAGVDIDIDGQTRPQGSGYDIGADEFQEFQPLPALTISKQAEPDPVRAGGQLTYTIRVTNTGSVNLHATVTDTLPAHVTPTGVLTWTPIIPASGGVWIQQVVVTVEAGYSGLLTNVAWITTTEGASGIYTTTTQAQVVLGSVGLAGPISGVVGSGYTFTATVVPPAATLPITYTWQAASQSPVTHTLSSLSDTMTFTWAMTGTQVITVTAVNPAGNTVSASHTLVITPQAQVALGSVGLAGPISGVVGSGYTFTATVTPPAATLPITYTWRATHQSPITRTLSGLSDTAAFIWSITGTQVITVTALNPAGNTVSASHTIVMAAARQYVYLPLVLKNH